MTEGSPHTIDDKKKGLRFPSGVHGDVFDWETARMFVPCDEIGYICSIFEAYDNEFLVRTDVRGVGQVRIWYHRDNRARFDAIIREMRTEFNIDIAGFESGMADLDEVFPD